MNKWVRTEDGVLVNLNRMDYIGPGDDNDCIIAVSGNPGHAEDCNILFRSVESREIGKMMSAIERHLEAPNDVVLVVDNVIVT